MDRIHGSSPRSESRTWPEPHERKGRTVRHAASLLLAAGLALGTAAAASGIDGAACCAASDVEGAASAAVPAQEVVLRTVDPNAGRPGSRVVITIRGAGFGPQSAISIRPGIRVDSTRFDRDGEIRVWIRIDADARPGPRDIVHTFRLNPSAGLAAPPPVVLAGGFTVLERGQAPIDVPAVVGEPLGEAERLIREAGLPLGPVAEEPSNAPAGVVIGQAPEAGARVAPGTAVTMRVSLGPRGFEIHGIEPSSAVPGSDVVATLRGTGFNRASEIRIDGVDVASVELASPRELRLALRVPPEAGPGSRDVVHLTPGGPVAVLSGGFTIQAPPATGGGPGLLQWLALAAALIGIPAIGVTVRRRRSPAPAPTRPPRRKPGTDRKPAPRPPAPVEAGAVPAPEPVEAAPPVSTGEEVEQVETVEPVEVVEPLEPVDTVEAIEPVKTVEPPGTVGAIEPLEPVDTAEAIEPVETVEPIGTVDTVETVETVEPVGAVEPVEAIEPLGPVDPVGAVEPVEEPTESTRERGCPACGEPLRATFRVCPACGERLGSPAPPAQPAGERAEPTPPPPAERGEEATPPSPERGERVSPPPLPGERGEGAAPPSPGERREEAAAQPSPPPQTEEPVPVRFTAFHPKETVPDRWSSVLVYVHVPAAEPEIQTDGRARLAERVTRYATRAAESTRTVRRGSEIRIVPELAGFRFNPPTATLLWLEDWHCAEFRVRATADTPGFAPGTAVNGRISFFVGPIMIGELPIWTYLGSAAEETGMGPAKSSGVPFRRIFASYSHDDTEIVSRLKLAYRAIGDDFLQDVDVLRSGEDWNAALLEKIDSADVFQLFWSEMASQSRYVEQEWRRALKRGLPNFLRPVYWRRPLPPVPPELRRIHFRFEELT